jgi:hypothetical protein
VAGQSLPPRYVWAPTLRKSDLAARRRRYRVWYRVPTASSPMGSHANPTGAAGAGQHRLKWRHFSPALTICWRSRVGPHINVTPTVQDSYFVLPTPRGVPQRRAGCCS